MNIYYNTSSLTHDQKVDLIHAACKICCNWWVDKLDCSKSFRRQKTSMTLEEILDKFDEDCHFSIIYRNSATENYIEIGFRTMSTNPEYFLWIQLQPKYQQRLLTGVPQR